MISKQQIKFINSLQYKKYRKKAQAFLVEGEKCVEELFDSDFEIIKLVATAGYLEQHKTVIQNLRRPVYEVSAEVLCKMGSFKTGQNVLAVVKIPENKILTIDNEYVIALDELRDPGNLGTIIRIADWYGIKKILVSENSVDLYNPKVIHATMGSFTRVQLYYCDLPKMLDHLAGIKKYGAFMQGENVHKLKIESPAILVIGNEANGIGKQVSGQMNYRISIPKIGGAESLNAAVATAIICDNLYRDL